MKNSPAAKLSKSARNVLSKFVILDYGDEPGYRAGRLLAEELGVSNLEELLLLTHEKAMAVYGLGRKTWSEIHRFQVKILDTIKLFNDPIDPESFWKELIKQFPTLSLAFKGIRDPRLTYRRISESKLVPILDLSSFDEFIISFVREIIPKTRNADISIARLGIRQQKLPTLAKLARSHGLTRERVRQIEFKGLKTKIPKRLDLLNQLWDAVDDILNSGGGIQTFQDLADKLRKSFSWKEKPSCLALVNVLKLIDNYDINTDKDIVTLQSHHCPRCKSIEKALKSAVINSENEMISISNAKKQMIAFCRENCKKESKPVSLSTGFIIEIASRINLVVQDNQVMTSKRWDLAYGKSKYGVIKATLNEIGEPVHYSVLADRIRQQNLNYNNITDIHVYNCLTTYKQSFTWVIPGTYALVGWETKRQKSHPQAIVELLKKRRRAMSFTEIIDNLTKDGSFKVGNIRTALATSNKIVKVGDKLYDLKERVKKQNDKK